MSKVIVKRVITRNLMMRIWGITYLIIIVARKFALLKNEILGDSLFLKMIFNRCPNATLFSLTLKDPMKIGYLALFVDFAE